MKKRGQSISLFIILALLIIIGASLTYYALSGKGGPNSRLSLASDQVLNQQTDEVKLIAQDCLEQNLVEAKELFGLREDSKPLIEEHIEGYLADCIHENLDGRGILIEEGRIEAKAEINTLTLSADVIYPIKVIRGQNSQKFSKLNYYLPLESAARLNLDALGRTTEEYRILSHDGRVELIIPVNTKITDTSGNPLREISLRTADRNEGGLVNSVVIGMTVYDGQPEGARFEPAITILMRYDPDELMGLSEEDLKIGWYDGQRGFWWGLPSSEVDKANRLITAELSHFTKLAEVACTPEDTGLSKIEFSYKTVILGTSAQTEVGQTTEETSSDTPADTPLEDEEAETPSAEDNPADLQEAGESCGCQCSGNCRTIEEDELEQLETSGKGYFSFTIKPDGQGCIMEKPDGEADMKFEVLGSPGDTIGASEDLQGMTFKEGDTYTEINTNIEGLKAGQPYYVYYSMDDTDGNGCVWSIERVTINGRGITYPEQCAKFSDAGAVTSTTTNPTTPEIEAAASEMDECTVQDAINTLCGKGDHEYNDVYPGEPNCEKDSMGNNIGFLDPTRAPTLNAIIYNAMSVNPSSWRPLPFNQLPNKGEVLSKIQELGLTMTCNGGSGYTCVVADSSGSSGEDSTQSTLLGGTDGKTTLGKDPEASSASTSCTAWEMGLSKDQLKALIAAKTKEIVLSKGMKDADYFASLMIGIATQESGIGHCKNGQVLTGDYGVSIGMMQVNQGEKHCTGSNIYRLECNIESAVNVLINKYDMWDCEQGHTHDCTDVCETMGQKDDCSDEVIFWQGWDCAIRGYNGMGCKWKKDGEWVYCGPDCHGYVENVKEYAGISGSSQTASSTSSSSVSYVSHLSPTTEVVCTEDSAEVDSCQQNKGVLLDSVSECDFLGGWPIYHVSDKEVTSGRKVCCRQEGCCIRQDTLTSSGRTQCTGEPTVVVASLESKGKEMDGSCGEEIIEIAETALGHPYELRGQVWDPKSSPKEGEGIDCSTFTKWVYDRYAYLTGQPDYTISNNLAKWQAANIGRVADHDPTKDHSSYKTIYPDCSELKEGDLVFFYNTAEVEEISHVGIYIGGCRMIHAGWPEPDDPNYDNPSTHKVQIVRLDSDLRKEHYIGAKRLCPDEAEPLPATTASKAPTNVLASPPQIKGTFEQKECKEVTGCCVWEDDGCKKAPSTQSACRDKTFFPLENGCESHPECESAPLGYSGKCRYCGTNAAAAKQIDPGAACSGGCCEADCPSGTVIVPDVVYYNQCRSFGEGPYCGHACGPTSLKMALEAQTDQKWDVNTLWKGIGCYPGNCGDYSLANYARSLGHSTGIVTRPSKEYLKSQIDQGNPMVITTTISSYSSQGCSSGGGHFILLVGYADDYMIVNDPFCPCTGVENLENLVITNDLFFGSLMTANTNNAVSIT